ISLCIRISMWNFDDLLYGNDSDGSSSSFHSLLGHEWGQVEVDCAQPVEIAVQMSTRSRRHSAWRCTTHNKRESGAAEPIERSTPVHSETFFSVCVDATLALTFTLTHL